MISTDHPEIQKKKREQFSLPMTYSDDFSLLMLQSKPDQQLLIPLLHIRTQATSKFGTYVQLILNKLQLITVISSCVKFKDLSYRSTSTYHYCIPFNSEWFALNFQDQISVSNIMTDRIWRETGARYRTDSEANAAGFSSGTSADYALGQDQVPFVYTIYAPSGGNNGWDVPEDQIKRIVDEIFVGIRALAEYLETLPLPTSQ